MTIWSARMKIFYDPAISDFQDTIFDQMLTNQQGCVCAAVGRAIWNAANGLYVWVSHLPRRHLLMPSSDAEKVGICGCNWRDRRFLLFLLRLPRSRMRKYSEEVLTWEYSLSKFPLAFRE